METIVVSEAPSVADREAFDSFQEEWCNKIEKHSGIKTDFVHGDHEYAWHDHALYARCLPLDGKFFTFVARTNPKDVPEILCQCGNVEFTLRYGYYEIKARCTQCGEEESVYDG